MISRPLSPFPPSLATPSLVQRLQWLRLIRSENVGPVTFRRLLQRFGSAEAAIDALPDLARQGGRSRPLRLCSEASAEREFRAAAALGATLLCQGDPAYPKLLAHIDDAPPCLYATGNLPLLERPCIAMVGTRNASLAAKKFATAMAMELGTHGLTVVSGLARGLDTAAHQGSLETGTVAVIAGGPDSFYPPENRALQTKIATRGVILSEMPPGTEPQARHFPRRNRIISGISLGVIVLEASIRSGSLITARLAAEQGRDVFAVPGSPLDSRCEGPNALLKEGAILTRHARDVLDVILSQPCLQEPDGPLFQSPPLPAGTSPTGADTLKERDTDAGKDKGATRDLVMSVLSFIPVTVDEILRQCQLSPSAVLMTLLELELAGCLERHPGNRVSLLPENNGQARIDNP